MHSQLQKKRRLVFITIAFITSNAFGQVNIAGNGFQYQQNFNGLSTVDYSPWQNNLTIPNWYAVFENNGGTNFSQYRTINSVTVGALYSYGEGNSNERALGSLTRPDHTGDIAFGVLFQNNSGASINSFQLAFDVEHWRRGGTSRKGYQRTKVSYQIAPSIDLSPASLLSNTSFIDLPEAYLISNDTTRNAAMALIGNLNSEPVSVSVPVNIPAGWQIFIRFYDEDLPETDHGLAVDNFTISFYTDALPRISASNGHPIFDYLDMGIVSDIPDQTFGYTAPTDPEQNDWQTILENFFAGNLDMVDASASNYGYLVVELSDGLGKDYQILRKQSTSGNFWGTYVRAVSPLPGTRLVIQSPHPVDDLSTGTQGAAVFYHADAAFFMVAGTSRCASGNLASGCIGFTNECGYNSFRMADVAHATNSIFHLATKTLAAQDQSLVFVQLHGFGLDDNTPDHFYISCGTENEFDKDFPDYAVRAREFIKKPIIEELVLGNDPINTITEIISHVDGPKPLSALTNVQGRFLNSYPENQICAGVAAPQTVTNRFLQIEQWINYREDQNRYVQLANALNQAINQTVERAVSINSEDFIYEQKFDAGFDGLGIPNATSHTWGNNLHLPYWYAAGTETGLFSSYNIAHGQMITGGIYSFGANNSLERALGSIATSPAGSSGEVVYGVLFRNDTGQTLRGLELDYDCEHWRDSNADEVQTVEFSYRIADEIKLHPNALLDDGLYIHAPEGNFSTPFDGIGPTALDGNSNVTHKNFELAIELQPGQELFLRFYDPDNTSNDKAQAIDNFTASFSSEAPMPVNWAYFKITKKNGKPLLQWGADNEDKCKNYEVLRSDDGEQFESIATLSCKGNRTTNHYEFVDHAIPSRKNTYYKIIQYDHNGDNTYSLVKVFVRDNFVKPNVYSENDQLIIAIDTEETLRAINVYDLMGRTLCSGKPNQSNSTYSISCPQVTSQPILVQMFFDDGYQVARVRLAN